MIKIFNVQNYIEHVAYQNTITNVHTNNIKKISTLPHLEKCTV